MASNDPIYISSDEEEGTTKRTKLRKYRSPEDRASKPKCRAKSLELPVDQRGLSVKRSSSVPTAYTVQPIPITRSTPSLKPERSLISAARSDDSATAPLVKEGPARYQSPIGVRPAGESSPLPGPSAAVTSPKDPASETEAIVGGGDVARGTLTSCSTNGADLDFAVEPIYLPERYGGMPHSITLNQSSMNPLDDLAIEPIQHPERYGVLVADRTATNLSGQRDYIQQPETTSCSVDVPYEHQPLQSAISPNLRPIAPAVTNPDQPPNSLKRKVSQGATKPHKRTRASFVQPPGFEFLNGAVPAAYTDSMQSAPTPSSAPYYQSMGSYSQHLSPNRAPYYQASNAVGQLPSNQRLWSVPAHNPTAENSGVARAVGLSALNHLPPVPASVRASNTTTPNTTKRQTPQSGPKRARQWNCGMIADLAVCLASSFDAASFAEKHGIKTQDVSKVFEVYIRKPLSAFSIRGQSRAMMKDFKEKMKEHEKHLKEVRGPGAGSLPGASRRRKTQADQAQ